jgi:hypothetical protein
MRKLLAAAQPERYAAFSYRWRRSWEIVGEKRFFNKE